jgi:acetyltransferase
LRQRSCSIPGKIEGGDIVLEGRSNMDDFFAPKSIALLGASNKPGKMGHRFMHHLTSYAGRLYPIHRRDAQVLGRPAFQDPSQVPGTVDLLIAVVPAEELLGAVRSCPPDKFRFLLAIPSGFGELSFEGTRLQDQIVIECRRRGMRVVGPNSLGMFNCNLGLNASMVPELPHSSNGISCVTQSGGFGMALSIYAKDHHLPVASFCDVGNMADLEIADIMGHFGKDPATRLIGLFLEASGRSEAFAEELAGLAIKKPIVAAWIGRSKEGRRASLAHLGTPRNDPEAATRELGRSCFMVQTGHELLHVAKALSWQPIPTGPRLGIVTGSGGIGAELADLAIEHGLAVPEFSADLQLRLKSYLPFYAASNNPVDLTPLWMEYPKLYPPIIRTLVESDAIDMLIVTIIDVATGVDELIEELCHLATDQSILRAGKPIYLYWNSPRLHLDNMARLQQTGWPCYQSSLETIRVASAISARKRFLSPQAIGGG